VLPPVYRLTEYPLRKSVVGTPCGSIPPANKYSEVPDWLDLFGSIVKGFTTPLVEAKHGIRWNVGLEARDTIPATWPGTGGLAKAMAAFTGTSNAELLSVAKPSSEPEAEPDEIVGMNVATKLPGALCVARLHAETSPTA
jgi:hypothetical protein